MIILGIDPGYGRTGYAVLRKRSPQRIDLLAYGCIETEKHVAHHLRLALLEKAIQQLMAKHRPDLVAVEKLFFVKNVTTALRVGEARGVILASAGNRRLPVVEFTPTEIKLAVTGYGSATKTQIQKMIGRLFGLTKTITPDDAADAVAVAWAALHTKPHTL